MRVKQVEVVSRRISYLLTAVWVLLLLLTNHTITANAQSPQKLSTSGYKHGMLNNFRVDAVDPDYVDGEFVNQFLDYYPRSRLRGHGDVIVKMADKHGSLSINSENIFIWFFSFLFNDIRFITCYCFFFKFN